MKQKIIEKIKKILPQLTTFIILILIAVIGGVYIDKRVFVLSVAFLVMYAAILIIWSMLTNLRHRERDKKSKLLTNVTVELLMELKMPVAILDADGSILWYNQSFADVSDEKTLYDTNINDLLETRLNMNHLKESLCDQSLDASFSGIKYRVDSYKINSGSDDFYITVWKDITEIDELESKLDARNPVVAYIYVDNSVDASAYMTSAYRELTAKISGVLNSWVISMNGILREFDRDKYIAVFDKSNIKAIIDSKCDILDKVREISENADIAMSVSIGIACLDNATFQDKEQIAHQALDLAMQRGGDQAVLRYDESSEYYGGRFKAVQKRTKIRSRFIANDIIDLLKNSGNAIIMGHRFADHDSIGSCIGMASLALEYCSKVNVVVNRADDNIKAILNKMENIPKYQNVFIDAATGQDLVAYNTLLIICDVNNMAIFESKEIYENVKNVVIIDHHRKTGEFIIEPKVTYIEPSASSASELVSEILEQAFQPGALMKEEAEMLFAGMVLDTKGFTRNTGVRTFSAALYLRGEGASPAEIDNYFKSSIEDFMSEAQFESNVVIYRDSIAISLLEGEATVADKICASKAADRLLGVEGVLASFALCKVGDTVHISARSLGTVNVQLILEKLNGGGHYDAAGAQVKDDSVEAVLIQLKQAIDGYLDSYQKKG